MEKYELVNQIGDGTFGSVAKAVSKKTGQLVAIKKMKQKYYTWEECIKLPEVDVVRKIHGHPNIVKLREVIRENNELFFVFEFMDSDLLGVIKKAKQAQKPEASVTSPAIPYHKIKLYMRQLLQSLAYLHKRGYFHRDLKPENLLVRRDGQDETVKLADFGLVKEIRARPPFTDYVSTRWYRSPELLLQDRNYSSPVDIWAAACIMCELITTKPLFPGTNEVDQLFKIMNVLGSPNEKIWPGGLILAKKIRYSFPTVQGCGLAKVLPSHIPPPALELIELMLTYDPKKRPTAEQCLQHPYFNVGIDDNGGVSAAAIDQLASAARRLQQSPQSAPAAMQNTPDSVDANKNDKLNSTLDTKRSSLDDFSTASPQKIYAFQNKGSEGKEKAVSPKKTLLSPKSTVTKDVASAAAPKPNGIGIHLANVKLNNVGNGLFAPSPGNNKATPTADKKDDLDVDGLLNELASELESEGLTTTKECPPESGLPKLVSPSDRVADLLANARFKREGEPKAPPLSLKNVKPTNVQRSRTNSNPHQAVSPSIKALLAKYRV